MQVTLLAPRQRPAALLPVGEGALPLGGALQVELQARVWWFVGMEVGWLGSPALFESQEEFATVAAGVVAEQQPPARQAAQLAWAARLVWVAWLVVTAIENIVSPLVHGLAGSSLSCQSCRTT